jgi:hypothetical protein
MSSPESASSISASKYGHGVVETDPDGSGGDSNRRNPPEAARSFALQRDLYQFKSKVARIPLE